MKQLFCCLSLVAVLVGCSGGGGSPPPYIPPITEYVLSGDHSGEPVRVSANSRYGAAIYSIVLGNFQFVDSADHGREVQTAWQLDGQIEGQNPTEAGSSADGNGYLSSTKIISAGVTGNVLTTKVNPAYWLVYNGQVTSPHILEKTVTLGHAGRTNVLRHQITMTLNEPHQEMSVEGLTAYLSPLLTRYFLFDPVTKVAEEITPPLNGMILSETRAVLVANANLSRALALVHKNPEHKYWIGRAITIPKIDASWFHQANPSGSYSWETFTIFGTMAEVLDTAAAL